MDEFARATKTNQGDAVTSTETPAPPAKKQAGTAYIVLIFDPPEKTGDDGHWDIIGPPVVHAGSARAVVAAVAESHHAEGTLVAVPTRSWAPVRVTVTSKPVITLEDA